MNLRFKRIAGFAVPILPGIDEAQQVREFTKFLIRGLRDRGEPVTESHQWLVSEVRRRFAQ